MSSLQEIVDDFAAVGARATIRLLDDPAHSRLQQPLAIDVSADAAGEYFDIQLASRVTLAVVDKRPDDRHLVLRAGDQARYARLLCGHDEQHWFVAALPRELEVETVTAAKQILKPGSVVRRERKQLASPSNRRNDTYFRQGEWFFVPCRHASIDWARAVRGGELVRSVGSKPHCCDYLFEDGEREYINDRHPKLAYYESEYLHIVRTVRKAKAWKWRPLPFEPAIYAKGWVRHADHAPMFLDVWHRVEKNREPAALAMTRIIFLD